MKRRFLLVLTRLILALTLLWGALPARAASEDGSTDGLAPLPAITIAGQRLLRAGEPFEVRGVNYVRPTGSPADCPELHFGADPRCPWEIALINADMVRLSGLGVNTIRVFLNYYAFGGARETAASYNLATPLAHLDALVASANRHGIYVIPVLLAKFPQDQLTEAGVELALDLHVAPVVGHLAGRPGVLAWDLFNEPDIGSPLDERCWDWDNADFPLCLELAEQRIAFLTRLHYEVKWLDQGQLTTIGMAFAKSYFRPAELPSPLAALVDVYSFHYYDDDPYDAGRYGQHWYYGQGLPFDLRRGIEELHGLGRSKPVLITELGFPSGEGARRDELRLRADLGLSLGAVRAAEAAGVVLWPFQADYEVLVGELFAGDQKTP